MAGLAIETRALTKAFGSLKAVDSLDLQVEYGEVFGFLGPNGAGKTTTLRLMLDFIRPSSGSVQVLGGSGGEPGIRRRIGYLPADLDVHKRYTGQDLLDYFGKLRGGYDAAYARDLTRRFQLDLGRRFGELSTGNKRKVGIVQAFMHRPELLILDEPTSGLDPLLQEELHNLVRETSAAGATVFLCSHILPEVEELATRVGIIKDGRLATVARIDELRGKARHRLLFVVEGEFEPERFRALPGVFSASRAGATLEVVVEGSVDAVLKEAAKLTVKRIQTPGDDLAEIFMGYYEGRE